MNTTINLNFTDTSLRLNTHFSRITVHSTTINSISHGHGLFGWFNQKNERGYINTVLHEFASHELEQINDNIILPVQLPKGETDLFIALIGNNRNVHFLHRNEYIVNSNTIYVQIEGTPCNYGCFITTATLATIGKDDDCEELNIFRKFRDNYVQDRYPKFSYLYYNMASLLVKKIDLRENSNEIYKRIWNNHISLILSKIKDFRMEESVYNFKHLLLNLCEEFLSDNDSLEFQALFNRRLLELENKISLPDELVKEKDDKSFFYDTEIKQHNENTSICQNHINDTNDKQPS